MKQKEDIMLSPEDTEVGKIERSIVSLWEDPRFLKRVKAMHKARVGRYKEVPVGKFNRVTIVTSTGSSTIPTVSVPIPPTDEGTALL